MILKLNFLTGSAEGRQAGEETSETSSMYSVLLLAAVLVGSELELLFTFGVDE